MTSGGMDAGAQASSSERKPGWLKRTSGDGVWVARSRLRRVDSLTRFFARDEIENRGAEVGEAFLADALHAQQRRR